MRVPTGNPFHTLADFRRYEETAKKAAERDAVWRRTPSGQRKTADSRRLKVYGLTPERFDALVLDSCGRCAICHLPADLAIDHCHASGVIRGLLCDPCNRALGLLETHENREAWLSSVEGYLSSAKRAQEVAYSRSAASDDRVSAGLPG